MPRRFVSKRLHGSLDFLTAGIFLVGPELFRVRDARSSSMPARAHGLGVLALSLLTDYGPKNDPLEFGGPRTLSMRTHVTADAIGGVAVGLAPFLSGSWRRGWNYWAPQFLVMSAELFFAATTTLDD